MITHWHDGNTHWCEIHCGCCGMFFVTPVGGSVFCQKCIDGSHEKCKVREIMGVKS